MRKKILIGIGIVLIGMQLIPTNYPEASENNPEDLFINNTISNDIESLIKTSCYDCHSNQSKYPWYSNIAPVSFVISNHINEGREHLNFSEWETLSKLDKAEALDDLMEEVDDKKMPLNGYLMMHSDAELTDEERNKIMDWADVFAESIFE